MKSSRHSKRQIKPHSRPRNIGKSERRNSHSCDRLSGRSSSQGRLPELDLRVQAVVNEPIAASSEQVSLQVLAARVGLSASRLAHLFRRDVGIPVRKYRLSLRIYEAIAQVASGESLTRSAHMAGFADSSYFCRIYRRMLGSYTSGLPGFALEKDNR